MRAKATKATLSKDRARGLKKSTVRRSKPVAVADVMEWICERIRRGRLVPGQRLVEADIMGELAAPRARVREALQRLSTEGLVVIEEFRGASVKSFTLDEVRQMYRARMALEGLAAGDFAAAPADEQKQRLLRVQEQLNALEDTVDHERFAKLNDEWHRTIIAGSGNAYVRTFVARLRIPIYRLLFASFYDAGHIAKANAGHRRITEAIVAGRSTDAERWMREHIAEGFAALAAMEVDFN